MIDVKRLLHNPDVYRKACRDKGYDPTVVDGAISLHGKVTVIKQQLETVRRLKKVWGPMTHQWLQQNGRLRAVATKLGGLLA